ncbi:retinoschisin-like isoform X2 [Paramuricea clavata]|nr:retinoschisin-like isoform X2 [Paramuricea clavata]
MDKNLLASQYCSDTLKEIYTKYTCVDAYGSSTITTAPRIRLSRRNTGFIEIRNGSTWRRVVEENWDKNRQKMLCQHLGFEETADNKIVTKQLGSGQNIATGDFVCYNTIQPSGTSCCIHLEPSTSPPSTKITDVQCKICDKPLLHDTNDFPDSVFSGSGDPNDNYERARITKGGWCPWGSGTRYLMLDLQKQYHITQVVVMADSSQTRWSSSYSLKYSHNKTLVDGSSAIPIKGNKYGFKASTTNLTIYNVRYLKIESTDNQNFCLRIELCGEVQTPAPVKNINVSPSDYSARVTWEIPTPQDSTYITHYLIYLNNKFVKEISRAMYGTEFNILPLKPNTENTFGIQTKDGSVQGGTYVSETFTTKQAEPFTYGSIAISYSSLTISKPPAYIK